MVTLYAQAHGTPITKTQLSSIYLMTWTIYLLTL